MTEMKPICLEKMEIGEIIYNRCLETRRKITPREGESWGVCKNYGGIKNGVVDILYMDEDGNITRRETLPYQKGDILYVREDWQVTLGGDYFYRANYNTCNAKEIKWRSRVTMPKKAARLFLQVTDVHVEHSKKTEDRKYFVVFRLENITKQIMDKGIANDVVSVMKPTRRRNTNEQSSFDLNPSEMV